MCIWYGPEMKDFGSAIPVKIQGQCFIITAWHVVDSVKTSSGFEIDYLFFASRESDNNETLAKKVWIEDGKKFELLGHQLNLKVHAFNEHHDIIVFEADESEVLDKLGKEPFDEEQLVEATNEEDSEFMAIGFPSSLKETKQFRSDNTSRTVFADESTNASTWGLFEKPISPEEVRKLATPKHRSVTDKDIHLVEDKNFDWFQTSDSNGLSGGGMIQITQCQDSNIWAPDKVVRLIGMSANCIPVKPAILRGPCISNVVRLIKSNGKSY